MPATPSGPYSLSSCTRDGVFLLRWYQPILSLCDHTLRPVIVRTSYLTVAEQWSSPNSSLSRDTFLT